MTPHTSARCAAMALALAACAGAGQAQDVDFDGGPPGPVGSTPNAAPGLRLKPEPPAARLRCWQRGQLVLDEALGDTSGQATTGLITLRGAQGQALNVFAAGTGFCLATGWTARRPAAGVER